MSITIGSTSTAQLSALQSSPKLNQTPVAQPANTQLTQAIATDSDGDKDGSTGTIINTHA